MHKVEIEQLRDVLVQDVIKREALDSEKAASARKLVNRAARRTLRSTTTDESASSDSVEAISVSVENAGASEGTTD
jgi:hypothetical protein